MRWLIHLVAVWVLATTAAQSSAAETIVTNGKLLGATGVLVNGSSYNVSFVDGTCAALFSGCDQNTDFVFQDSAAARAASQALLDQVFLGIYDTNPELTSGCSSTSTCTAFTPFLYRATPQLSLKLSTDRVLRVTLCTATRSNIA